MLHGSRKKLKTLNPMHEGCLLWFKLVKILIGTLSFHCRHWEILVTDASNPPYILFNVFVSFYLLSSFFFGDNASVLLSLLFIFKFVSVIFELTDVICIWWLCTYDVLNMWYLFMKLIRFTIQMTGLINHWYKMSCRFYNKMKCFDY